MLTQLHYYCYLRDSIVQPNIKLFKNHYSICIIYNIYFKNIVELVNNRQIKYCVPQHVCIIVVDVRKAMRIS